MSTDLTRYLFSFYAKLGQGQKIQDLKAKLLSKFPDAIIDSSDGDETFNPVLEIKVQSPLSLPELQEEMEKLAQSCDVSFDYGVALPPKQPSLCPEIDEIMTLLEQENWQQAEKIANSLITHKNPEIIAEAQFYLYLISAKTDQIEKSIQHLRELTQNIKGYQPTSSDFALLSIAYCKNKQFDLAHDAYLQSTSLSQEAMQIIENSLAYMNAMANQGQTEKALDSYLYVLAYYKDISVMDETHLVLKLGPHMIPLSSVLEIGVPVLKLLSDKKRDEVLNDVSQSLDEYGKEIVKDFKANWTNLTNKFN